MSTHSPFGIDLILWAIIMLVAIPVIPIGLWFGKIAVCLYYPVAFLLFIGFGYLLEVTNTYEHTPR